MTLDDFVSKLENDIIPKIDVNGIRKIIKNDFFIIKNLPVYYADMTNAVALSYYLYENNDKNIIILNQNIGNQSMVVSNVIRILEKFNIKIEKDYGKGIYFSNSNKLNIVNYRKIPIGCNFDWFFMEDIDYISNNKFIEFYEYCYTMFKSTKGCKLTITYHGLSKHTDNLIKILNRKNKIDKLINSKS